jgi:uncharacterized membrane protein YhhN
MRNVLLSLFTLFALFYVFFLNVLDEQWYMFFKLIPMMLLLVLAFTTTANHTKQYKLLVSIGLVFCAIGDYTLQWFLIGLSSFLIGHIFYIFAFRSTNEASTPLFTKIGLSVYGLVMAFWIAGSLFITNDYVMAVAVIAYICVILTMGWMSFRTGTIWAIVGALLFIASDSVLAVNKFTISVPFSHEIIMFTYYGAQLCFVMSIVKYDELRSKVVQ